MDTRRFGSNYSNYVGRGVLIVALVITFALGLSIVSGPIIARREAEMKDKHIRSIEQMAAEGDWSGIDTYLSENDLYGSEYEKYRYVHSAKVGVAFIEGCMSRVEKYINAPISEYYTEKDRNQKVHSEVETIVYELRGNYRLIYREVYDRGVAGNEMELLGYLETLEEVMTTYGYTEDEILEMYRYDDFDFKETILFQQLVEKVKSYYIAQ